MDPIVQQKLDEIDRMPKNPALKRPKRSSNVRVVDNNLSRVIHTQEDADRFMMEVDALDAYDEMLWRKRQAKKR